GKKVIDVVVGAELVERNQPPLLRPDRRLIGPDREDVELAALGGDVGRHLLAQHILFERDPVQLDVGIGLGEIVRQLLHPDHVAVVDGGDRQRGVGVSGKREAGQGNRPQHALHVNLHGVSSVKAIPVLGICQLSGRIFAIFLRLSQCEFAARRRIAEREPKLLIFLPLSRAGQRCSRCSAVASSVTRPEMSRPANAPRNGARREGPIATPITSRLSARRNGAAATRALVPSASTFPAESNAQPVISPTAPAWRSASASWRVMMPSCTSGAESPTEPTPTKLTSVCSTRSN